MINLVKKVISCFMIVGVSISSITHGYILKQADYPLIEMVKEKLQEMDREQLDTIYSKVTLLLESNAFKSAPGPEGRIHYYLKLIQSKSDPYLDDACNDLFSCNSSGITKEQIEEGRAEANIKQEEKKEADAEKAEAKRIAEREAKPEREKQGFDSEWQYESEMNAREIEAGKPVFYDPKGNIDER